VCFLKAKTNNGYTVTQHIKIYSTCYNVIFWYTKWRRRALKLLLNYKCVCVHMQTAIVLIHELNSWYEIYDRTRTNYLVVSQCSQARRTVSKWIFSHTHIHRRLSLGPLGGSQIESGLYYSEEIIIYDVVEFVCILFYM